MESTQIIAITGEKGAGKDTLVSLLQRGVADKVIHLRVGAPITQTLELWGATLTRENQQLLPELMKAVGGNLVHAFLQNLQEVLTEEPKLVLIETVRWLDQYQALEEYCRANGIRLRLIYVTADPNIRFERLKGRARTPDEREMSWEQFDEQEKASSERQIKIIGNRAEVILENNGTLEEFRRKVARLLF